MSKKLYSYKDLLGTTENYTYFNDYYIYLMTKLDDIYERITGDTSLVVYKRNLWQIVLSKVSKLFRKDTLETSISVQIIIPQYNWGIFISAYKALILADA